MSAEISPDALELPPARRDPQPLDGHDWHVDCTELAALGGLTIGVRLAALRGHRLALDHNAGNPSPFSDDKPGVLGLHGALADGERVECYGPPTSLIAFLIMICKPRLSSR